MGATGVGTRRRPRRRSRPGCGQLLAVAENYPDLKASQNFLALQEELTGTESKIAYARQFYNDQVMRLNTLIQIVPLQPDRQGVPLRAARVLRHRRAGPRAGSGRALEPPCTSRSQRTSARPSCSSSARSCSSAAVGYAIGLLYRHRLGRGWWSRSSWRSCCRSARTSTATGSCSASTRAREVTPEEEPRLHNIVEGLAIAAGRAEAARLRRARAGAERVRHRPRPGALVGRGDPGAARDDEPGRAGGRDRPRDVARAWTATSCWGPIVATLVGAAVLLSEFFMRSWWWGGFGGRRASGNGNGGGGRADRVRDRLRAADPGAARSGRSSSWPCRATGSTWRTRRERCSPATRPGSVAR